MVPDHLEAGNAHRGDRALVLGIEREVVEHDVAAGDTEDVAVAEGGERLPHVRDGLGVEASDFEGVLRLGVGEEKEGVARLHRREPLEREAGLGFAATVREDGLVEPGGAGLLHRDPVPGGQADGNELGAGSGQQGVATVPVRRDGGDAVRDPDASHSPSGGTDPSANPCERARRAVESRLAVGLGKQRVGDRESGGQRSGRADEGAAQHVIRRLLPAS